MLIYSTMHMLLDNNRIRYRLYIPNIRKVLVQVGLINSYHAPLQKLAHDWNLRTIYTLEIHTTNLFEIVRMTLKYITQPEIQYHWTILFLLAIQWILHFPVSREKCRIIYKLTISYGILYDSQQDVITTFACLFLSSFPFRNKQFAKYFLLAFLFGEMWPWCM